MAVRLLPENLVMLFGNHLFLPRAPARTAHYSCVTWCDKALHALPLYGVGKKLTGAKLRWLSDSPYLGAGVVIIATPTRKDSLLQPRRPPSPLYCPGTLPRNRPVPLPEPYRLYGMTKPLLCIGAIAFTFPHQPAPRRCLAVQFPLSPSM